MDIKEFNKLFDHTILKAVTTREQLKAVCDEAAKYGFCSVAVNTGMVRDCAEYLRGSGVLTDAAVGFPLGITTVECKLAEAEEAIRNGADEIDYVVNIGRVKEGDREYIRDEMSRMTELCRRYGKTVKVIFENCYLTDGEKKMLCGIANEIRPDFIKTSTGFGPSSAVAEDVRLMRENTDRAVKIKAAGGIRDLRTAEEMIRAGAERIGCSCSAAIADEFVRDTNER